MKKLLIINILLICLIFLKYFNVKAFFIQYKIFIDPGHGGFDGGASYNNINEKDLNLEISLLLKDLLVKNNFVVELSRTTDISLSNKKSEDIKKRVELINKSKSNIYLSIHINSETNNIYKGSQVFYYNSYIENKNLAYSIQESLKNSLNNTLRKSKEIKSIYILKYALIPGCLIECGFLSNDLERNLLIDKKYQEKLVSAIYLGILNYLNL